MTENPDDAHFYTLFQHVPIPLMESDYSLVYAYLEKHRAKINNNLRSYFQQFPEELTQLLNIWRFNEVNTAALEFFKVSNKETLGKKLTQFYSNAISDEVIDFLNALLQHQKHFKCTAQIYDSAGIAHTVEISITALTTDYSRTLIILRDISEIQYLRELEGHIKARTSELEQSNQQLQKEVNWREQVANDFRQSETRYRQLIAIYPVGIIHINIAGEITYVNTTATELLGLTGREKSLCEYCKNLHPEDLPRARESWDLAIRESKRVDINYRVVINNKLTWIHRILAPEKDANGNIIGHVAILADVTKTTEAEAQITKHQEELAQFARLSSMGAIASTLAHELNQPLAAINTYSSGLKRYFQKPDAPNIAPNMLGALEHIIAQATRAGDIIHHLKEFLRKGTLNKKLIDANQAIKDILVLVNRNTMQNQIIIKLMLDNSLPPIFADKIQIEQVLLNIISNAVDAIKEANPEKRVIVIRTKHYGDEKIRISIGDTGIGITHEFFNKLFTPFATTKNEGMGIGLSLCYNIIEKHGGQIKITSRPQKGSIFHIILPIKGVAVDSK